MRILYILFVIIFVMNTPSFSYAEQRTIEIDDVKRNYIITKPSSDEFKAPYPVIFVLHGGGGSAFQIQQQLPIEKEAHAEGFITIFPDGMNKGWNDGRLDKVKLRRTGKVLYDDVGFFDAIIAELTKEKLINPEYIFFTGVSNGGMMTMRMGCERADKIRAIAPIIANMPVELGKVCSPEIPISVMMINGTEDRLIPHRGGYVFERKDRGRVWSTARTLELWLTNGQCELSPELLNIPGGKENTGQLPITKYSYKKCADGISVYLFDIIGGGHAIPSSGKDYRPILLRRITGERAENLDAEVELISFFKSFID